MKRKIGMISKKRTGKIKKKKMKTKTLMNGKNGKKMMKTKKMKKTITDQKDEEENNFSG